MMRDLHGPFVLILLCAVTAAPVGCADRPLEDDPPLDQTGPELVIETPERGTITEGDEVTVRGRVRDDGSGVARVLVDGAEASVGGDGAFDLSAPMASGLNLVETVAEDESGNTRRDTRAILAGPFAEPDQVVDHAAKLRLGRRALAGLAGALSGALDGERLSALADAQNPIIDVGGSCLGATASIDEVELSTAEIELSPTRQGLAARIEARDFKVSMDVEFAVACISGDAVISLASDVAAVSGTVDARVARGEVEAELSDAGARFEGVVLDLAGLPPEVVDLVIGDLDGAVASAVTMIASAVVPSMIEGSFARVAAREEFEVMGAELRVGLWPRAIEIDDTGLEVTTDLEVAAVTGASAPPYPRDDWRGPRPLPETSDVYLAVRITALNQVLSALWSAGAMTEQIALGDPDGNVGQRLDGVNLEMLLPPTVVENASESGVAIGVGDLLVDAVRGSGDDAQVVTRLAVSSIAHLAASVDPDSEGALDLAVAAPDAGFNVIDQGPDALDLGEVEDLASFTASRLAAALGDVLGELPLPAVGGVTVREASLSSEGGELVLRGGLSGDGAPANAERCDS